jgi:hypothetical protein
MELAAMTRMKNPVDRATKRPRERGMVLKIFGILWAFIFLSFYKFV